MTRTLARISLATSAIAPSCAQALVSTMRNRSRSARSAFFTPVWSDSMRRSGSIQASVGGVAWALTMRTSLPIASRIPSIPSSLPSASQSGRTWLVSTTFWQFRNTSTRAAQSRRVEAMEAPRKEKEGTGKSAGQLFEEDGKPAPIAAARATSVASWALRSSRDSKRRVSRSRARKSTSRRWP